MKAASTYHVKSFSKFKGQSKNEKKNKKQKQSALVAKPATVKKPKGKCNIPPPLVDLSLFIDIVPNLATTLDRAHRWHTSSLI